LVPGTESKLSNSFTGKGFHLIIYLVGDFELDDVGAVSRAWVEKGDANELGKAGSRLDDQI
jgi:hypothetical protein